MPAVPQLFLRNDRNPCISTEMTTAEIRRKFLEFFESKDHTVTASSSLVPVDDPSLLFTNAGMVQFKAVFLGEKSVGITRAVTSQKCVRAGGKHNDLEEVGRTSRHHTFFEMLGNFSFGDYFKRDAIKYAWELVTDVYGLDPDRLFATVHQSDDEAAELWSNMIGLPPERIYRLGDEDNFWQMADTGPCGPCSEIHYDVRPESNEVTSVEEFVQLNDAGKIMEIWNLVFMQFDRDTEGTLKQLPAPCVDTGAGLERIASVLQGVDSNFHIDLFAPLLDRAAELVGKDYDPDTPEGLSFRVLADHARAVAFLLADGVLPASEGRGYVLRRILRRGVRHAWLLGKREPILVGVIEALIDTMGDAYPELVSERGHILRTTRGEEERFLITIEGGMARFGELVSGDRETIPGEEVFKLYDTFGFPADLTELMAVELGFSIDMEGFQAALDEQRERSRADRAASQVEFEGVTGEGDWVDLIEDQQSFVGYDTLATTTDVLAYHARGESAGLVLRENPFYMESGGQISDVGKVTGDSWSLTVQDVRTIGNQTAILGLLSGSWTEQPGVPLRVEAAVNLVARNDTIRNHTATHLLHAALRSILGTHVVQRGSLVTPDRLRFDFAHEAPLTDEERAAVEAHVNEEIWSNHSVEIEYRSYKEAVDAGAMALFGEKYAEEVRIVNIPGVSMELCGGTHVTSTGDIGLFRLVSETGVAAGVRRIEALTGRGAFAHMAAKEAVLQKAAAALKTAPENLSQRAEQLLGEQAELEALFDELRLQPPPGDSDIVSENLDLADGVTVLYRGLRFRTRGADDARKWGDAFLSAGKPGVAVLAAELPGEKYSLFVFVTDELIQRGVRADIVVREIAAIVGGKGGGRAHMAQGGVEDPIRLNEALSSGVETVRILLSTGAA